MGKSPPIPLPHIPDLAAMNAVKDQEIRIYALIGVVVVLSSSLEAMLSDIFERAEPIKNASEIIHAVESPSARLKMGDIAMRGRLSSKSLTTQWKKLYGRISAARHRQRHIVAHGEMSMGVTLHPGMSVPTRGKGHESRGSPTEYHFSIRRDQPQLTRVSKKGSDVSADSLFEEATDLASLIQDLSAFLNRLS